MSEDLSIIARRNDAGVRVGDRVLTPAERASIGEPSSPRQPIVQCIHRGDQISLVDCPTCTGRVRVRVFSCSIHGRCRLSVRPIDGVRSCRGCADASPVQPADPG